MSKHVVKIERVLDMESSRNLKGELVYLLESGVREVELDFSLTESVDSSGLGKLLLFNEKFREAGGSMKVINVSNQDLAEMFQLLNLDKLIAIQYIN